MPGEGRPARGSALHSVPARRRGPSSDCAGSGPIRTCVGCRQREQADELLRLVLENGHLVPDPRHRLPGRGAWLHPTTGCLDRAERRSAFNRAFRVRGQLDATAVRHRIQDQQGPGTLPGPSVEESMVDPS
ncbi:YlxR family protein [Pseudonocardia phyllosphaerae]|uniref:YlxR family protein n=1 Tax=Pseudonocardia phyllosphaerae TaxID=3390502 RepID=UPI00397CFA49